MARTDSCRYQPFAPTIRSGGPQTAFWEVVTKRDTGSRASEVILQEPCFNAYGGRGLGAPALPRQQSFDGGGQGFGLGEDGGLELGVVADPGVEGCDAADGGVQAVE
ncbi:hypothetical protein SBA4_2390002 [Candidatus Sulfopaludibacter sp. SbA4]|nr:hypothetical protein SBA4_2390002 [Candidatus Sulfopaludibacter sp. SbA4]